MSTNNKKDDRLTGKVAKILDLTKLVINLGSKNGVKDGMIFDVIDVKGQEIKDPDTGEIIGSIDRPKIRVKVDYVMEKLSIAKTFKATTINVGGMGASFSGIGSIGKMMAPPKYVKKVQTLKTNEKTWEDLEEKDSLVKTGDVVILSRDQNPDNYHDGVKIN